MCGFGEAKQNQGFSHIASKSWVGDGAVIVEGLGVSIESASRGVSVAGKFPQSRPITCALPAAAPFSCRHARLPRRRASPSPCRTRRRPVKVRIPLDLAQHSEMISPTVPI